MAVGARIQIKINETKDKYMGMQKMKNEGMKSPVLDRRIGDFLELVYDKTDDMSALPKGIAYVADEMRIGQIHVAFNGEDILLKEFTPYKKYDTRLLNEPDYEFVHSVANRNDTMIQFWKLDSSVVWDENDRQNMDDMARFLLLYLGRTKYLYEAKMAAAHDELTGLVNLTGFTQTISSLMEQGIAQKYTVLYMSAYKFKLISRKYGYEIGNQAMVQIAEKLKHMTHAMSSDQVVARLVNDNFAVVVRTSNLERYLEQLSDIELDLSMSREVIKQRIAFIVGVYSIKETDRNVQLPLEYAMAAYSISKQGEQSNVIYFNEEIHNHFLKEKDIEARMQDALDAQEFVVYYQPKINLNDFCISGAEALVRWNDNGQIVPPMDFIPLFERNGFICNVDFYVLNSVCQAIRRWLDEGYDVVPISVNFSKVHLANENFANEIVQMVKRYRVPTKYIEVEFTESANMEDTTLLTQAVDILKSYGIASSMDDFGTGSSSLSLLTSLPVDVLKIDKSLLEADVISERERVIVSNIVHMVQDLDIDVIMEGVETVEQVEFLKQINCNLVQGFLFDKPLPREEFEDRLQRVRYENPGV